MQYRISHAQNFEDVMLWRALKGVAGGRYIDIGAQSPDIDSVGRLFFEEGWRGVHVDANADYAAQLRAARPGDLVVEAAVTDSDGTLRFYEIPDTGLSTLQEGVARVHAEAGYPVRETDVEAITLDALFARAGEGDVHWLKIDVEGGETDVLRGWRTSPLRPWIVVVESTRPLSQVQSHVGWEPMLLAKGYRFAWFDGLNRFYVSDAHPELAEAFVVPPNLFDNFALSGKASAPFCRIVGRERDDALAALAQERQVVEQTRMEGEARLAEASAVAAADLERTRREAGEAIAVAIESEAAVRAAAAERERQLLAELLGLRVEVRRSQEDALMLRGRLQESRIEAHRWWVRAETLRAERELMLRSHSWRMTAPFRAARRLVSDPRMHARAYSRRALSSTMRVVVASPLRDVAQAMLAWLPGLRARMRAIAVADHVIPGVEPAFARALASMDTKHSGMSASARRVHARLRELLGERA